MSSRVAAPAAFALAFLATFAVALHTGAGLHDDAWLFRHVSGNASVPVRSVGRRALETIDIASVILGIAVVALFALVRGRAVRGVAAAGVVVLSVATAEGLKHGLPHVGVLLPAGRAATFPSGHTSVAASLAMALVIAVPPVLRPLAAVAGAAYAAGVGLALVVLAWHYPSDVIGSFFIAGFWASVAAAALARPRWPTAAAFALSAVAVVVGLVLAASVAARHPAAVRSLRTQRALIATAAGIGVVSIACFATLAGLAEDR